MGGLPTISRVPLELLFSVDKACQMQFTEWQVIGVIIVIQTIYIVGHSYSEW